MIMVSKSPIRSQGSLKPKAARVQALVKAAFNLARVATVKLHGHTGFDAPLEEVTTIAAELDGEDQLEFATPLEHIELQEPEYQAALGALALQRAQQWLDVARMCREVLVEQGQLEKSRKRVPVLRDVLPGLAEKYEGGE